MLHSHETHRPPQRRAETLFLELPTHDPCVVRRLSVALPVSLITGYTDPIAAAACSGRSACGGGIANLTMRKCRKRSRGKHTFGTAQDSRQVCLFHLARGHAENILAKRTTRHARARPPLRTPTLRYTSESRHLCQRTFEDSHTSHLIPHTMPHNALYLPPLWFYSQERQQKDRHRISQVGISDKRLAITPNQVGRHTERYRLVMCLSPIGAVSERVGHQVIVFGAAAVFGVALLAWSSVAIACMGIASPSVTLTGRFSRMPPAEKKSSTKKMLQSVTGSVVFRGIGHQTKQGKSEVRNQRKTGQGIMFARVENSCKKSDI